MPTPSTPCKTKSLQSPGDNTGHSSAEQRAQVTSTWWSSVSTPHAVLDTDKHSQQCKVHAVHGLFPLNCIQALKLLWQMTVVEKWCILRSQSHSRFPGLALVQPSFHACLELETTKTPASSAGMPASTKQGLAWSLVNQKQRQHWCLSSSVTPGGCSPSSHHCVMRCLGKFDSWSLMTPQTPRGWSSLAVSSVAAAGDTYWDQRQSIQGSSSRGGQAPSPEVVQGVPVPSWNGEPQPLQVSPVLCGSGSPPKPSWERAALEKTWAGHTAEHSPEQAHACPVSSAPVEITGLCSSRAWRCWLHRDGEGCVCVQTLQARTIGVQSCSCRALPSGKSLI